MQPQQSLRLPADQAELVVLLQKGLGTIMRSRAWLSAELGLKAGKRFMPMLWSASELTSLPS